MNSTYRRIGGAIAATAAAVAVATSGAGTASAAPAHPLTVCYVTTDTVPAYDVPNQHIVAWANQGQAFYLDVINGYWYQGDLSGVSGRVWIHSHYLRNVQGRPC